ncbi:putative phage protein gp47/JayE [Anaerosolibacter carboniphilus]|uniref:Putative phage protein gp47/JayE n=1 Tax=Anaerosolibacter carboniphilus TaxID=1417629 RepID=A0A841KVU6_9FIRM|nr:baseplate J/gp47 family protein [Anaerosolibacter carboniphilus]MBB6217503.1 putative phage protein gp47/JayE [Anaerosolibacter carboniphilus]
MLEDRSTIQNRMLSGIPEEYDTSEGSFFYDAVKPVAVELEAAYQQLGEILDKGFAETAMGEWLDKKAAEQGVYRKKPTKATTVVTITGSEGAIVNIGDKVASDTATFICKETKTIDATGQVNVMVECEEYGSAGNVPKGAIKSFPLTLTGLTSVTNGNPVTNGFPGESDEELRQRYFDKVRTPATSGNRYHYKNWAKEYPDVGDAKVLSYEELLAAVPETPPGTVKVVIIDSDRTGAEPELVDKVFDYIEELRPIGAKLIVESAKEVKIHIKASFVVDGNYTQEEGKANMEQKMKEYFRSIAFQKPYVSYAILGSLLLEAEGVLEYSNLTIGFVDESTSTIRWGMENISIKDDQVPVLGGITFE